MSSLASDASTAAPTQSAPPPPPPDQAQLMAIFAARARRDHDAMRLYAGVLAGLMGLFIIFHFFSLLRRPLKLGPFASLRRLVSVKVPGVPSLGHGTLLLAYLGLNVGFIFVYTDTSFLPLLAVANIVLTVFFSLKNTPLGYLTGVSYERLNILHRISGLTTFLLVVVHAASYSSVFIDQQNAARLRVREEIFGIVAGFSLLTVVMAALTLQRRRYELFYVLHVVFFVVSLVFISLHHPTAAERVIIAMGLAAGMWFLDRLVRASRLVYHGINNTATLQPLPNGGTRVILNKKLLGANPGEHAFLWIPGIRRFETHPFTIARTEPLEFVVASQDGFTRDLHQYASKNPGAILRASVEGPYGQIPDPARYDRVVIFAGGSGGSFAFGSALRLLQASEDSDKRDVTLVWSMRNSALLEWFSAHLRDVGHSSGFKTLIHITGQKEIEKPSNRSGLGTADGSEGALVLEDSLGDESAIELSSLTEDQPSYIHGASVHYQRPNVNDFVAQALEGMAPGQRVLVMACGPAALLKEVRSVTTSRMVSGGPHVSLHCEQFGW
ncbi:FAD-binding FR-type domain-containing protein [Fusarium keratoplasticum]|uniref:FAD-binding FR-type domain-containing protein n=1 Tax=Fusarium keratoplasticum TaxID=1328300 RepID=A0ACC0QP62_9HYPO|nr:FAD-binding FR-type domain-containing protein [Fusarium keratoplasticum]KAI8661062.1 FAD-binding FR-type domain-containing protein [Fusarium keratoplasticum]